MVFHTQKWGRPEGSEGLHEPLDPRQALADVLLGRGVGEAEESLARGAEGAAGGDRHVGLLEETLGEDGGGHVRFFVITRCPLQIVLFKLFCGSGKG